MDGYTPFQVITCNLCNYIYGCQPLLPNNISKETWLCSFLFPHQRKISGLTYYMYMYVAGHRDNTMTQH